MFRLVALALVGLLVVILGVAIWINNDFGTFNIWEVPPRVALCDRTFDRSGSWTWPRHDVDLLTQTVVGGATPVILEPTVGRIPLIRPNLPPRVMPGGGAVVCAMVVWLQVGTDAYAMYTLSGGP